MSCCLLKTDLGYILIPPHSCLSQNSITNEGASLFSQQLLICMHSHSYAVVKISRKLTSVLLDGMAMSSLKRFASEISLEHLSSSVHQLEKLENASLKCTPASMPPLRMETCSRQEVCALMVRFDSIEQAKEKQEFKKQTMAK